MFPVRVRLSGGSTANEGNVEALSFSGQWGGICDDDWDIEDAKVVCKMLGYSSADAYFTEARFGYNNFGNSFILDNLQCTGSESSIFDCIHPEEFSHDCESNEIAGVRCTPL